MTALILSFPHTPRAYIGRGLLYFDSLPFLETGVRFEAFAFNANLSGAKEAVYGREWQFGECFSNNAVGSPTIVIRSQEEVCCHVFNYSRVPGIDKSPYRAGF